jgi:hypothetical protein
MKRQFRTPHPQRLQLLRALQPPTLNGIDYLEVTPADQCSLSVVFVHPPLGLTAANFRIDGGVRIQAIAPDAPITLAGNAVTLHVNEAGDFSQYTLVLQNPLAPEEPPDGFDPVLSSIGFSFKVECPSDFDCAPAQGCDTAAAPQPQLDYLAKDYGSFRRLMLDRLNQLMPQSAPSNPADPAMALVELLAHVGDQLSYYQDAVATEAYLGTARQRVSLRRHARLLDYAIHEGCNSRVLAALQVAAGADGKVLPPATALLTGRGKTGDPVESSDILDQLPDGATQVFETMHPLVLQSAHNRIEIHSWSEADFCLARGSTAAALVDQGGLALKAGDLLMFEEVAGALTGLPEDADPAHRHAVRLLAVEPGQDPLGTLNGANAAVPVKLQLVRWHEEDALPFTLCVSKQFAVGGSQETRSITVARGNVVLADHGLTRKGAALLPDQAPPAGVWRPRLPETGLAFAVPYRHQDVLASLSSARPLTASAVLRQSPARAQAAQLSLLPDDPALAGDQAKADAARWSVRQDLLGSDRFAQEFVLETEHDGSAYLRFGDNRFGMAPEPGLRLLASYRLGGGRAGDIGPRAIGRIVLDDIALRSSIDSVDNPMAAQGGTEPEPADAIKLLAPEAFRTQERAVTEDDYARVAERHPGVQRAAARLRWTGSWYTMYLIVDRLAGRPLDQAFRDELLQFMERYRLAGYDLELADPVFVPLDIALAVCVRPGYFASDVEQALLAVLGSGRNERGEPGFFHPDRFSFGQALALSRLIEAAMRVTGVASIEVLRFQRWGKPGDAEIADGRILASPLEVLRLDNDPNFPENGRLKFDMRGGV